MRKEHEPTGQAGGLNVGCERKRGSKDEPQGLGPMSLLNVLYCDAEQWNDRFRGGEGEEIKNLNLGMLCSLSRVYLVSKRQLNPALRGKRGAEGRT